MLTFDGYVMDQVLGYQKGAMLALEGGNNNFKIYFNNSYFT